MAVSAHGFPALADGVLVLHLVARRRHAEPSAGLIDSQSVRAARTTIVRELDEEAGLAVDGLTELFEIRDEHGSGQLITFFAAFWDGDETALPLAEGVKLQFLAPEDLEFRTIPPFIRDGINRYQATRPA